MIVRVRFRGYTKMRFNGPVKVRFQPMKEVLLMKKIALVAMVFLAVAGAWSQTNIEFWHAMTGKNADTV